MDNVFVPTSNPISPQDPIQCSKLPLAVYREVAAHLRQVIGVEVELLPQHAPVFDYEESQVGGLLIRYTSAANAVSGQQVAQILNYYGDRYGAWKTVDY
jgi:hypothetical protein